MGFEGFVVLGAAVLLFAYVIPALVRRRMVLADAPIEDRFAEDLRMLEVSQAQPSAHTDGQHGSVFFRRPEVEMAGSEFVAKGVRELARDRSRARARIARRAAFMQRILLGVGGVGVLAVVAWIAVALTSLPGLVAGVVTALAGACTMGFGYLHREVAKADAADRELIAEIDAELGPRRAHGRQRASDIVRARTLARAKREASRQLSRDAAGEEIAVRGRANRKSDAAGKRSGGRDAADVRGMTEREIRARARAEAQVRTEASGGETAGGRRGARASEVRGDLQGAAVAEHANSNPAGSRTRGVKRPDVRADLAKARIAERASARNARAAEERPMKPSPRAEMPSYTLKPRKIERRVVDPYEAPTSATAPVPYRPHERGERYDAVTGTVMPRGADASDENAALAGASVPSADGATREYAALGGRAAADARKAGSGSRISQDVGGRVEPQIRDRGEAARDTVDEESPSVISSRSEEVLGGGSVLDALLERRRA